MRLYSRGQVVFFSVMSAVAVLALVVIAGWLRLPPSHAHQRPSRSPVSAPAREPSPGGLPLRNLNPLPKQDIVSVDSVPAYSENELQNINVYERLNAGVVNVTTETVGLNWFLEPVPREGGIGSGSIIDTSGYVLTNYHVVEKAYKVTITLADGQKFAGKVIGSDPENDLAVVKFDPGGRTLTPVPFGSSRDLRVGQKVLSIGNPFGLNRTLTTGIVSGLGRPIKASNGLVMRDMIQTDAAINPGNSGGPLLDAHGGMIGINTMIFTPSGGSVGIGFAVPVDTARRIVPDLLAYGEVRRGWIDIIPVQLDPTLVSFAGLPVLKGLLVSRVVAGGNAERAGIRGGDRSKSVRYGSSVIYLGGDVITAVDNTAVSSIADLFGVLEDSKPNEVVPVEVLRGGRSLTFNVTLGRRPRGLSWE